LLSVRTGEVEADRAEQLSWHLEVASVDEQRAGEQCRDGRDADDERTGGADPVLERCGAEPPEDREEAERIEPAGERVEAGDEVAAGGEACGGLRTARPCVPSAAPIASASRPNTRPGSARPATA
jgi:hypothetical protein